MIDNYLIYKNLPSIDLHGEFKESALVLLDEFINDNYTLDNTLLIVVHGKGTYTLKKAVHEFLKRNKKVKDYKNDIYNDGVTVVELFKKK